MSKEKVYNLEERTYQFARDCRYLAGLLPRTISNIEDLKQLIKSSGSVGANYIEANEKLGVKDLIMRLKIARKEVKEAGYWLRLLKNTNEKHAERIDRLIGEAAELRKIISAIVNRVEIREGRQSPMAN
ncbi:four helix bundle protein [Robiginitalea sediminis]|uniref:four helix bundle protein n=1 Tax=Robiginitalea sediminis TaxID=1982593 RepID=UPI000B4A9122|nr:four helix bundle protein [Robiginitalea sediminis]